EALADALALALLADVPPNLLNRYQPPAISTTTATTAPMPACICRRLRAAAARRAIWRSSLARARARWRSRPDLPGTRGSLSCGLVPARREGRPRESTSLGPR